MKLKAVFDPNWNADAGGGGKGAQNHFALSNVDAIAASYRTSEPWDDECDALVFMWATVGAMTQDDGGAPPDAYVLARLLRLRVVTIFIWCKVEVVLSYSSANPDGRTSYAPLARMGLGQWGRHEEEYLLLCTRGKVSPPPTEARPRSVIYAPRGEHSAKPEQAWSQVIEPISTSVMPRVRGVEWNARTRRRGWDAVGKLTEQNEHGPIVYVRGDD